MDTLSQILDALRFDASFYFATNFNGAWSIAVPSFEKVARFHYVTQGRCYVEIDGEAQIQVLNPGDIIIIPHGSAHILSDEAGRKPQALDAVMQQVQYPGQGVFSLGDEQTSNDTQLVCGHFAFDNNFQHPLIDFLPAYITKNENHMLEYAWLKDSLRFMAHIAQHQPMGSEAMIKRLSEVIFIQVIRYWSLKQSDKGFMAALNDPQLARGLQAFHQNTSTSWNVERLAEAACMSRSLLAEKFKHYLAMSPMQYVTNWRMQGAKLALSENRLSMEQIAEQAGYDSTAAFSKAFKRVLGTNPGQYRRNALVS